MSEPGIEDMAAKLERNNIPKMARESPPATMRCYFNLVNGSERINDQDGIEVRDIEQARIQALKAISELREEDDATSSDWANWSLEVTDSFGNILFSINLGGILH
jgi:hypothetical protein